MIYSPVENVNVLNQTIENSVLLSNSTK